MKKRSIALILVFVMAFALLAGCGTGSSSTSSAPSSSAQASSSPTPEKTYVIKIASAYADGHYMVNCYEAFKDYVEKESNGRIEVQIFANASIVSGDSDGLQLLSSNSVQMANSDFTMVGTFIGDKSWESTSIPYYYGTDVDNCYAVLDNAACWQDLYEKLETTAHIKILGCVNGGCATVSNAKHSIESMDDFKGLRIRTPESKPYTEPIKLWGGTPTPMSFGEIYTSIQQGVIDGVFTSKSAIVQYKFTELCKYHTDLNAFLLIFGFGINSDFYNSLPADLQQIVLDGAGVMVKDAREGEVEFRDSLDTKMEAAGVKVIKPDETFMAALQEAVKPYVEERRAEIPDFIAKLDKEMAEILKK